MAQTESGEPAYDVAAHTHAKTELGDLPDDDRQTLVSLAYDAATFRQPTQHPNAKLLRGEGGLFRLRSGDYRAICALDAPRLVVLVVDERKCVYGRVGEARDRLES